MWPMDQLFKHKTWGFHHQLTQRNKHQKLQLQLEAAWIDPRLEFNNLRKGQNKNFLSPEQKQKLWLPTLIFANNRQKMKADFDDSDSIGKIVLVENASYKLSPLHTMKRTRISSGQHGLVTFVDFLSTKHLQLFDQNSKHFFTGSKFSSYRQNHNSKSFQFQIDKSPEIFRCGIFVRF